MSPEKEQSLNSQLLGYASLAERHFRRNRPKLYAHLKKKGNLREYFQRLGDQVFEAQERLQDLGWGYQQAREAVLRTLVYLPDIGEEEEQAEVPDITTSSICESDEED